MAPAVKSTKPASSKSTATAAANVSEAPVGAVTRRKSLIMANANANTTKANKPAATEKQQVVTAAVAGAAVKPERRASRKNSRNDEIEDQRIEARNHASKKVQPPPPLLFMQATPTSKSKYHPIGANTTSRRFGQGRRA